MEEIVKQMCELTLNKKGKWGFCICITIKTSLIIVKAFSCHAGQCEVIGKKTKSPREGGRQWRRRPGRKDTGNVLGMMIHDDDDDDDGNGDGNEDDDDRSCNQN